MQFLPPNIFNITIITMTFNVKNNINHYFRKTEIPHFFYLKGKYTCIKIFSNFQQTFWRNRSYIYINTTTSKSRVNNKLTIMKIRTQKCSRKCISN